MNYKNILRWCAMPIAAVIGAFIAYFLIALWINGNIYGFQSYNGTEVGSMSQIFLAISAQAVFGAAFVYCGATVAPSYQRTCAVVLSTVISMLTVASFILSLNLNGFGFMQLLHSIATIVGAILAVGAFQQDDPSNNDTIQEIRPR